jgi:hypothetical protein
MRRVTVAAGKGTPKAVVTVPEILPVATNEPADNKKQRIRNMRLIIPKTHRKGARIARSAIQLKKFFCAKKFVLENERVKKYFFKF